MDEQIKDEAGLKKLLDDTSPETPIDEAQQISDEGDITKEGSLLSDYLEPEDIKEFLDIIYDEIGEFSGKPIGQRWRKASANTTFKVVGKIKITATNKPMADFILVHSALTLIQLNGMRKNGKLRGIWKKENRQDDADKKDHPE